MKNLNNKLKVYAFILFYFCRKKKCIQLYNSSLFLICVLQYISLCIYVFWTNMHLIVRAPIFLLIKNRIIIKDTLKNKLVQGIRWASFIVDCIICNLNLRSHLALPVCLPAWWCLMPFFQFFYVPFS